MRIALFAAALLTSLSGISLANDTSPKVLVMGDSLSSGYGIPRESGWVALLQNRLENSGLSYNIINASITGETTSGGANRIKSLLDTHQPDIVIIELGGNDGLRALSLKKMRRNLEKMIALSQLNDAQIVLLGMRIPNNYGRQYANQFHQIYLDLAEDYDLPLLPFFLQDVALNSSLMQRDGVHPNEKAQPVLLDNIWPVLSPLL